MSPATPVRAVQHRGQKRQDHREPGRENRRAAETQGPATAGFFRCRGAHAATRRPRPCSPDHQVGDPARRRARASTVGVAVADHWRRGDASSFERPRSKSPTTNSPPCALPEGDIDEIENLLPAQSGGAESPKKLKRRPSLLGMTVTVCWITSNGMLITLAIRRCAAAIQPLANAEVELDPIRGTTGRWI
jgi:hypothetical protein